MTKLQQITPIEINSSSNEYQFNDRDIYITDVNEEMGKAVIRAILEINSKDAKDEKEKKDFVREPINIYINSYGGCVHTMLALVNTIELSKTPVHTHCIGNAYSAGLAIFMAGHKRIGYRYSTVMYHSVRGFSYGDIVDSQNELDYKKKMQERYDDLIVRKTNITKEQLQDKVENQKDWYIYAEDFEKLKIVDEMILNNN